MKLAKMLLGQLEILGWQHFRTYQDDLEWWADEIWELKSRWSPEGAPAFLTFLVDPMWEGNREKGQGIWGIGQGCSFPLSRGDAEQNGVLRVRATTEEILEFIGGISRCCQPK